LLQLAQFDFQRVPLLANFARLQLGPFATPGFLSQGFRQPPNVLFYLSLGCLQLLCPGLNPGLFSARTLLLCFLLRLRFLQLLLQLLQLSFQFVSLLANLARLHFGAFPSPGLLSQGFRQPPDVLFYRSLSCLQLLGPRFEAGLLAPFTLGLQLLLRFLQFRSQLRLYLLILRKFGFQLAPPLGVLGSFHLSLQGFLGLLVFRQCRLELGETLGMLCDSPF
jgi:hypothetical protein